MVESDVLDTCDVPHEELIGEQDNASSDVDVGDVESHLGGTLNDYSSFVKDRLPLFIRSAGSKESMTPLGRFSRGSFGSF